MHKKSKYVNDSGPVSEVEINIFSHATEGCFNRNCEAYKTEIEINIDVFSPLHRTYNPDSVEKFLPTAEVLHACSIFV